MSYLEGWIQALWKALSGDEKRKQFFPENRLFT
jgi:hypothetical protein